MHGEGSVLIRRGIQLLLSKKNAPNNGTRAIAPLLRSIDWVLMVFESNGHRERPKAAHYLASFFFAEVFWGNLPLPVVLPPFGLAAHAHALRPARLPAIMAYFSVLLSLVQPISNYTTHTIKNFRPATSATPK